jgi:hypothetical protein
MLGLPISFAISLTESGWVLCILDEYGEIKHTLHCSTNEDLLRVLGEQSSSLREDYELKNGSKYLPHTSYVSIKAPLSTFTGHVLVGEKDSEDEGDNYEIHSSKEVSSSKKRKKNKKAKK